MLLTHAQFRFASSHDPDVGRLLHGRVVCDAAFYYMNENPHIMVVWCIQRLFLQRVN